MSDPRPEIGAGGWHGLALILLLLAACSGSDTTATGKRATAPLAPTVRDSAGIELAEHPADAFARAPLLTIDSVPVLTIGGPDAEVDLSGIYQALVLHDGRLVLFADGSVVVINSDGRVGARIGRDGEGPGEFRFARLVPGQGDTVLVQDLGTSRLSWVTLQDGVVKARPFVMFSEATSRAVVGQLRDDALVVSSMATTRPSDGVTEVDWPLSAELVTPDTDSAVRLATVRGRGLRVRRGVPEQVALQGNAQVVLARDTIVMTEGRRWEWHVVQPTGGIARIVRIVGPGQAIDRARVQEATEREIAAIRASIAENPTEGGDTVGTFARLRDKVVADTLGAIMVTTVGSDGTRWAMDGRYHFVDEPPVTYTAFRPSGTILGRLVIPKDRTAIAFGDGTVVLRDEDADGFVTLRVHRLNGLR